MAHPFFLFPGAHTTTDIPAQLTEAAMRHPGATWTVTEPLGLHPGVLQAATARIAAAIADEPSAEELENGCDEPVDPGLPSDPVA